jgi:hypothetical protein
MNSFPEEFFSTNGIKSFIAQTTNNEINKVLQNKLGLSEYKGVVVEKISIKKNHPRLN